MEEVSKQEGYSHSEFNSTFACFGRLDHELRQANYYRKHAKVSGNPQYLKLWKAAIESAYSEVFPKLSSAEKKIFKEKMQQFSDIQLVKNNRTREGKESYLDALEYQKYYKLCHQFEILVRMYATLHQMMIKDKADIDDEPDEW